VSELSAAAEAAEAEAPVVEVVHAAFAAMMELQWRAMFSAGLDDAAARALHDAAREAVALSLKPNVSDFFPALAAADLQGVRRGFARRVALVYRLVDEEIERRTRDRREAAGAGGGGTVSSCETKDLLDVMLDMSLEQGKDDGVTISVNRDVMRTFLTVSTKRSRALYIFAPYSFKKQHVHVLYTQIKTLNYTLTFSNYKSF